MLDLTESLVSECPVSGPPITVITLSPILPKISPATSTLLMNVDIRNACSCEIGDAEVYIQQPLHVHYLQLQASTSPST